MRVQLSDIVGVYRPTGRERIHHYLGLLSAMLAVLFPYILAKIQFRDNEFMSSLVGPVCTLFVIAIVILDIRWDCREVRIDLERITVKRLFREDSMLWSEVTQVMFDPKIIFWTGSITLMHKINFFRYKKIDILQDYEVSKKILEYARHNGIPVYRHRR